MIIDINNVHEDFSDKVKQSTGTHQINTYAVLYDNAHLSTDSLEKTIEYALEENQKYFFSRTWEQSEFDKNKITWGYPALIVNQDEVQFKNPFKKGGKRLYKFDFYLFTEETKVFELSDNYVIDMFVSFLQSIDSKIVARIKGKENMNVIKIRHRINGDEVSGVMLQNVMIELNNCVS